MALSRLAFSLKPAMAVDSENEMWCPSFCPSACTSGAFAACTIGNFNCTTVSDSSPSISDYNIRGGRRQSLANYCPLSRLPQMHVQCNAAARQVLRD